MAAPWAFGWTQLLAIFGLIMSGIISFLGLRTFDKWQREKVHERKLEVAFEALTLAYESGMVFDDIRRRLVRPYEWADMASEGMSKEQIERSQSTYAIINRISRHNDFFDRVLKVQPKLNHVLGMFTVRISNAAPLRITRRGPRLAECEAALSVAVDIRNEAVNATLIAWRHGGDTA